MKCRVLFFPVKWFPPSHLLVKLAWYQEQYEIYHAELDYGTRGLSRFQNYVFRNNSHQAVRDTWTLLQGGKEATLQEDQKIINL